MAIINTILCTCPDRESAEQIASHLVEHGLAACVSIIPGLTSIYQWEGKVQKEREELLLIKTAISKVDELQSTLVALHPYDVPEILVLPVERGYPPYLKWVEQCTTSS